MSIENPDLSLPDSFNGIVRVFPLPTLVLLPGVIQGMHLSDASHQRIIADALAADGVVATGWVAGPWAPGSNTLRLKTRDIVCLCRVLSHSRMADGTETCLLCGLRRAEIVDSIPTDAPFRIARVDVWDEPPPLAPDLELRWRQQILEQFERLAQTRNLLEHETIRRILVDQIPFSLLLDLIGSALELKPERTQVLLETSDLERRAEYLLETMVAKSSEIDDNSDFLPDFSAN